MQLAVFIDGTIRSQGKRRRWEKKSICSIFHEIYRLEKKPDKMGRESISCAPISWREIIITLEVAKLPTSHRLMTLDCSCVAVHLLRVVTKGTAREDIWFFTHCRRTSWKKSTESTWQKKQRERYPRGVILAIIRTFDTARHTQDRTRLLLLNLIIYTRVGTTPKQCHHLEKHQMISNLEENTRNLKICVNLATFGQAKGGFFLLHRACVFHFLMPNRSLPDDCSSKLHWWVF